MGSPVDGETWKCVIDNPHGTAREVNVPDRTAAILAGDGPGAA